MWSTVSLFDLETHDVSAPGAPAFVEVTQLSNAEIKVVVKLPAVDADGSALTGLAKLVIVSAAQTDAGNPFQGLTGDQLATVAGAEVYTFDIDPSAAGTTVTQIFKVISAGKWQCFAAACNDLPV